MAMAQTPMPTTSVTLRAWEKPLLKRDNMHMRAKGGEVNLSSRGELFLTTQRMIFVPKKTNAEPLELELSHVTGERFNQPIFGVNNISGALTGPISLQWKCSFYSGGAGTFLHVFFKIMAFVRRQETGATVTVTLIAHSISVPHDSQSYTPVNNCLHVRFRWQSLRW